MTTAPPDAYFIGDGDVLGHKRVGAQPTALANGYGRTDKLAMHAVRAEDVVMVEDACIGAEHSVRTDAYVLSRHKPAVGVKITALSKGHACARTNLQATTIVNIDTATELHDAILLDDKPHPAPQVHGLAAMRQTQPVPKSRLRSNNARGAR